jgi:hypothetical protein
VRFEARWPNKDYSACEAEKHIVGGQERRRRANKTTGKAVNTKKAVEGLRPLSLKENLS